MNTIHLHSDKQLQIFMQPKRQDILHLLSIEGPATAKMIADMLEMTASSAKHHLMKLVELGVVEEDHTEVIHGITATYYRKAEVTVSFSDLDNQKRTLVADFVSNRIREGLHTRVHNGFDEQGHFLGDQLSGVLHLTKAEADELYTMIRSFIQSREKKREGTEAFVYSLVAYHA